jgi:outer membrane protein TolC
MGSASLPAEVVVRLSIPSCPAAVLVGLLLGSLTAAAAPLDSPPGVPESLRGDLLLEEAGPAGEPGPGASLEELVRYAEERSPEITALEAERAAALAGAKRLGALPDPVAEIAVALEPVETRTGPQKARLGLAQTLPGRGKRSARAGVALAAAEESARRIERERSRLRFRVAGAYLDYYYLRRSLEVTRDSRDLLVYLEEVVRRSYETGGASYADLIREQVEIGRIENDLRSLEDRLGPARERLNTLLRRPSGAPLPEPSLEGLAVATPAEEELRERLAAGAPELAVLDASLVREEGTALQARREDRPDWTVFLNYLPTGEARTPGVVGSGADPVYLGVRVNLPLGRKKYRAAVAESEGRQVALRERRRAVEDELRDRLSWTLYELRNAEREVDLYRDTLIPKASQSLEASQAGFRAGTTTVSELVEAQQVLLQFQLSHERAQTERGRRAEELRMLLGGPIGGSS